MVNLRAAGADPGPLVALNLFLVGEGVARLVLAAAGRPVGSLFGIPLRPVLERMMSTYPRT